MLERQLDQEASQEEGHGREGVETVDGEGGSDLHDEPVPDVCPMCHTVSSLFYELGVCAAVHELDKDPRGREMERELARRLGRAPPVPAVFIGGKLVGSTDKIMSLHLAGKLVPMLKGAGAIWL